MHRAALALRAAVDAPEKLCHHRTRRHSSRDRLSMIAVRSHDVVAGAKQRHRSRRYRFLSDVEMAEAADLAERVRFRAALLEAALQQHRPKQLPAHRGVTVRWPWRIRRRLLAFGR